jgi:hypothetical protein
MKEFGFKRLLTQSELNKPKRPRSAVQCLIERDVDAVSVCVRMCVRMCVYVCVVCVHVRVRVRVHVCVSVSMSISNRLHTHTLSSILLEFACHVRCTCRGLSMFLEVGLRPGPQSPKPGPS